MKGQVDWWFSGQARPWVYAGIASTATIGTIASRCSLAAPHFSGTKQARHSKVATFDITEQHYQLGEHQVLPSDFPKRLKKNDVLTCDEERWKIGTKSAPPHPASPMPMPILILSISSASMFSWHSCIYLPCESHLAILPPSSDEGSRSRIVVTHRHTRFGVVSRQSRHETTRTMGRRIGGFIEGTRCKCVMSRIRGSCTDTYT